MLLGYTSLAAIRDFTNERKRNNTEVSGRNVERALKRFQTAQVARGEELPSADSDATDPSMFRYSGAFASTPAQSEQEADLDSVSSVSPTVRLASRK